MSGPDLFQAGPKRFNMATQHRDLATQPNSPFAAPAPEAHVTPSIIDGVNWFDSNTLQKWRDLHTLKILHIDIVESLTFLPDQTRKTLFLRLNEVGWPLRLRTIETARSSILSTAGIQWFVEDRNALVALRQYGLSWTTIANTFFAGHTAQDCMEELIRLGYNPIALALNPVSSIAQAVSPPSASPSNASNGPMEQSPGSHSTTPVSGHHQTLPVTVTSSDPYPAQPQSLPAVNAGSSTFVNHHSSSWTAEEDNILRAAYNAGITYPEIKERFLPHRTAKAMNTRMYRLRQLDEVATTKVGQ